VYNASFTFTKPIIVNDLQQQYALSFYSFFNCPNAQCSTLGDTLKVKIGNALDGEFEEVYKTGADFGRVTDNKWLKETIRLNFNHSEIFVILHL
jgi:hypothetical protein